MTESLRQLTLVRIREFWREPEAVFWAMFFPIMLTLGLGVAFRNRPPSAVPVAVVGEGTAVSSTLAALRAAPDVAPESLGVDDARLALRTGRVALLVHATTADSLRYEFDDARPDARSARLLADDAIQRGRGRTDAVQVVERHVREPGSRYIDFVVPGLLGTGLMGNGIWLVGWAVIDARRRKLLKRLMATPMSRVEFLASLGIPRLLLVVVEVALLVLFARFVFDVPLRGSFAQFALICLVSSLAFIAIGLLLATRARTMEGASGIMNAAIVPMWIFSGVFFSSENFPDVMQPLIQALPLTAVIDALRGNMLRAAGWDVIGPEMAILGAWTILSFALALKLFRWR